MSNTESETAQDNRPKLWSKAAEEKLKKEFYKLQREKCKETMSAFATCAKEAGFMVTFRCRDAMHAANDCLKQHTTDEQYASYRKEKIDAWVEQGVLIRPPK
jgi:hypothetical protein